MSNTRAAALEPPVIMTATPDYELAIACQSGDRLAFQRLVKQYQEKIRGLVYSILSDPDTLDDVVQDIFIKVYSSIRHFEHRSNLGTWIYRIAVNHCRDEIRKRRIRRFFSLEKMELDPINPELKTDAAVIAGERTKLVQWGLSRLPDKHRTIIILRDFDDLSYEEIAQVLNLELGTVKSRLNRARLALKEILAPYWSADDHEEDDSL